MAKIKIPFNNKNYSIDESSLSDATSTLKSHLSTVMNGTGATIDFGGVNYNVDAAKLTATTNAFISHLGTVSGNGYKVKVGNVEYSIDANKMTDAVRAIEKVLGSFYQKLVCIKQALIILNLLRLGKFYWTRELLQ